jgi:hypothetical protein
VAAPARTGGDPRDGGRRPAHDRAARRHRAPAIRRQTRDTKLQTRDTKLETAYCAEVLAITYQAMGLLPGKRDPSWFDAGRFWSGDNLGLTGGYRLGGEIAVRTPDSLETAV